MTKHYTISITEEGVFIDNILINEKIFQEEMSDYGVRDKETEIDNLIMWIGESKSDGDKLLMKNDLRTLMDYEGEYFLSSISTNDFLFPDDTEFHEECEKILKLNNGLKE